MAAPLTMVIECKMRNVSRPMLNGIVGNALQTNPDVEEVVIFCKSVANTVYPAIEDWWNGSGIRVTIKIVE